MRYSCCHDQYKKARENDHSLLKKVLEILRNESTTVTSQSPHLKPLLMR